MAVAVASALADRRRESRRPWRRLDHPAHSHHQLVRAERAKTAEGVDEIRAPAVAEVNGAGGTLRGQARRDLEAKLASGAQAKLKVLMLPQGPPPLASLRLPAGSRLPDRENGRLQRRPCRRPRRRTV